MLALIVGNCVLMAMKDPLAAQQARADWRPWVEGARARAEWRADLRVSRLVQPAWSQSAELTFTVLFTTECCLKMVAMGLAFESKTTYFRDAWNDHWHSSGDDQAWDTVEAYGIDTDDARSIMGGENPCGGMNPCGP